MRKHPSLTGPVEQIASDKRVQPSVLHLPRRKMPMSNAARMVKQPGHPQSCPQNDDDPGPAVA
jgi:hypothetical protein